MQQNKSTFFFTFLFICSTLLSWAQADSPYSRFGIGNTKSTIFSSNRSMGGWSAAYNNPFEINQTNPASLSRIGLTTLDIGGFFEARQIRTPDSLYKSGNGIPSHLAFAFPVKFNKWGTAIGLVPVSNISYNFASIQNIPGIGNYNKQNIGSGDLYNLFLSNAYQYKDFSIGLTTALLFGKLEYQTVSSFPDSVATFNTRTISRQNVRDFDYTIGIQYRTKINKQKIILDGSIKPIFLTAGAYGRSSLKADAFLNQRTETFELIQGLVIPKDTALITNINEYNTITLPSYFGFGISIESPTEWLVGMELRADNWSSYQSVLNNGSFVDKYRLSVGGEVTPKAGSKNYFNNVRYRLGGFAGKSELKIGNEGFSEYGITFGFGLPVRRTFNKLNLASFNLHGEIGSRNSGNNALFKETYYQFGLSFTVNDKWFNKRKFD